MNPEQPKLWSFVVNVHALESRGWPTVSENLEGPDSALELLVRAGRQKRPVIHIEQVGLDVARLGEVRVQLVQLLNVHAGDDDDPSPS